MAAAGDPEPYRVERIGRIALVTSSPRAAAAFYRDALGFSVLKVDDDGALLELGGRGLELIGGRGRPYPQPASANDPWFQHFAIAVRDMEAAYRRLAAFAQQPITEGGPQRLPPSTGSVTAYKFRDPDGHPLELSYDPAGDHNGGGEGPFLRIDHTALAVRDLRASVAFYRTLGFAEGPRFFNTGPEQDRLDGLPGVELDIVVLTTPSAGPHIELLHYRHPASDRMAAPPDPDDLAATRTVLEGAGGREGMVRDPDGRLIALAVAANG